MAFFLSAAREAGVKVSPYIMKNKKPRAANGKKRVKATSTPTGKAEVKGGVGIVPPVVPPTDKPSSEILLGLMHTEMKQPELDAIWTLVKFFKTKGK